MQCFSSFAQLYGSGMSDYAGMGVFNASTAMNKTREVVLFNAGFPVNRWVEVESSCFRGVMYDTEKGIMHVEFKDGGTYAYECNEATYEAFMSSASKGKWYKENIRGKLSGTRERMGYRKTDRTRKPKPAPADESGE